MSFFQILEIASSSPVDKDPLTNSLVVAEHYMNQEVVDLFFSEFFDSPVTKYLVTEFSRRGKPLFHTLACNTEIEHLLVKLELRRRNRKSMVCRTLVVVHWKWHYPGL